MNTSTKKSSTVSSNPLMEAENLMQGCNTVGQTYNAITGKYASQDDLNPLLAINGIRNPKSTRLEVSNANDQAYEVPVGMAYNPDTIESIGDTLDGSSKSEFSSKLSITASIDARYGQYQGSIDAYYSTETTSNNEEYYSEVFDRVSYYNLGISITDIDITTTDLNNTDKSFCISAGLQQEFDNLIIDNTGANANVFFSKFGTHALMSIIMGGQCRYAAYGSQSDFAQEINFNTNVKAKYMSVSGSATFKGEVDGATEQEESKVESRTSLQVLGGEASYLSGGTTPDFASWFNSISANLAWIDYAAAGTVGLWDLCNDVEKSSYLKSVFGQLYGSNYYTFTTTEQHTTLCRDGNKKFEEDTSNNLSWAGKDNEVMVGLGGNINSKKRLKALIVIAYDLVTGEYVTYYRGNGDADTQWQSFYMAPKGSIITGIGMRQKEKEFANLYVWYQALQLADQSGVYLNPEIKQWSGQAGNAQKVNPKNLPIGSGWCADGVTTIAELNRYYQAPENNTETISGIDANSSKSENGFNYLAIIQDQLVIDKSVPKINEKKKQS